MTAVEGSKPTGLVARVQNILLKPGAEWDVIATEPATTSGLFTGYAAILAVLPLIGTLIARLLLAGLFHGIFGMGTLVGGVLLAVVGYVLSLAMVYVAGLIINALAPSFDAKPDSVQALKVAVYANTAGWVAGLVSWIPLLGWLIGLAALAYGCYLLYLGVAKVMKPPAEKAVGYTIVVIVVQVVLFFVVAWITAIIGAMALFGAAATAAASMST
jgi:hypothetical protein